MNGGRLRPPAPFGAQMPELVIPEDLKVIHAEASSFPSRMNHGETIDRDDCRLIERIARLQALITVADLTAHGLGYINGINRHTQKYSTL
jgi:hypothetical protein